MAQHTPGGSLVLPKLAKLSVADLDLTAELGEKLGFRRIIQAELLVEFRIRRQAPQPPNDGSSHVHQVVMHLRVEADVPMNPFLGH